MEESQDQKDDKEEEGEESAEVKEIILSVISRHEEKDYDKRELKKIDTHELLGVTQIPSLP